MADGLAAGVARYRAFISYSHRDAVFAARLHRRLESYVLPKRLGADRRLTPIFKDREELPAAHDLSAQVRAALAMADCLIVLCSPDAAASPWVGREIELFRELHPERPILAALIRGEPTEAFPPALAAGGVEPLAADFRKAGDGDRLALLKLIAGIAGVGVDQLVQRDAQRRLRGVMAVTGIAVAGMLAMGTMTAFAFSARAEAERQKAEAESLVEFMLTDLRDGLKGAVSLKVLTKVNARALRYYSAQDLAALPAKSLERRALLLRLMGEDNSDRGEFDAAKAQFEEAYRVTAVLLDAAPDNPDRIFAHAQNAYGRGFMDYQRGRTAMARNSLEEYRTLAHRLEKAEPGTARSLQEVANAEGNLCSLALKQEKELERALRSCTTALALMEAVWRKAPETGVALDLATRWAWLADVQSELRNFPGARQSRLNEEKILTGLLAADPKNTIIRERWGNCQRGLSFVAYQTGDLVAARRYLLNVQQTFLPLVALDPENKLWQEQVDYADFALGHVDNKLKKERGT